MEEIFLMVNWMISIVLSLLPVKEEKEERLDIF
jgi:hypothetical protein